MFNNPTAIAVGSDGSLYIADTLNHSIRRIDTNGNASTIAGGPDRAGYQDGPVGSARFLEPSGIAVGDNGAVYVADTGNHVIRKIENGMVTTVAGAAAAAPEGQDYAEGGYLDGPAHTARLSFPRGLCYAGGALFIADSGNHAIRALTSGGDVVTVAGSGQPGDKDGPPGVAMLHTPLGVAYASGTLYIADSYNNKIKTVWIDLGELG
jgi:sugar lactone lactonase YvrE